MLGPFDYVLWLVGFLLEIYVVVSSICRKDFLRYLPLNFYMLCDAFVTFGLYFCLKSYGFNSPKYFYFYYYTDSLLMILMICVLTNLFLRVFAEMGVSSYIRNAAAAVVLLTAVFSYAVVHQNRDHLTSRFVVELGQNLYFVGVVLAYLLWGAVMKLRETRTRLIQLVLALGVYVSATAGTFALRNLFPGLQPYVLRFIPPIMGLWLPLAWAYTFTKIPENSRVATELVAARVR